MFNEAKIFYKYLFLPKYIFRKCYSANEKILLQIVAEEKTVFKTVGAVPLYLCLIGQVCIHSIHLNTQQSHNYSHQGGRWVWGRAVCLLVLSVAFTLPVHKEPERAACFLMNSFLPSQGLVSVLE